MSKFKLHDKVKDIGFNDCNNGVVISVRPIVVNFGAHTFITKYTAKEVKKWLRLKKK